MPRRGEPRAGHRRVAPLARLARARVGRRHARRPARAEAVPLRRRGRGSRPRPRVPPYRAGEEADVDALDDHAGADGALGGAPVLREEGPSRALPLVASRLGRSEPGMPPVSAPVAAVAERLGARTLLPRVLGDLAWPGARAE